MKEEATFYSECLARFVSVFFEDEIVRRVTLKSYAPHNNLLGKPAAIALQSYLRGENVNLSCFPVYLENRSAFERAVLQIARQIPRGTVATYSQLAARLNNPQAARAVGNALRSNDVPLFVPCHRVVAASGIGGYAWGTDIKKKLLQLEGVQSPVLH